MAFLDFLRRRRDTESKATIDDMIREMLAAASSKAGVAVNHQTALQATVAFACARVIAQGMSSVPFRLMRSSGGRREPATDESLFDLFDVQPNALQTAPEFFDTIGLHLTLAGRAIVWKSMRAGSILELMPLEPSKVEIKVSGLERSYRVNADGKWIDVPAREIWQINGPSWDGAIGLDGVKLAREALGLAIAAEEHGAKTFANGASVSGILTTDAALTKEQRDLLRESWLATYSGSSNAGKVAVMSNGMKFIQTATTNTDAQWLEGRKFQVEEVCRAFGVQPIMVGYSDKTATYASAEQMFIAHVTHTLGPWYRRVEKSASANLLTKQQRADGLYFKFFSSALLRGAVKDRGEFYATLYSVGAINPNEIRELEDMNPYQGGEKFRVPLNMADPNAEPPAAEGNI